MENERSSLIIYPSGVVYNVQVSHCQCETCASGRGASGAVQRQLQPVAPWATCRIKAQPRAQDKVVCLFVLQSGLALKILQGVERGRREARSDTLNVTKG